MKYVRYVGVLVAATLMMSVVGVASASAAEPEFKPEKGAGAFPVTFEGTLTKVQDRLVTKAGREVKCTEGNESKGEIGAAREVKKIIVTFKKCEAILGFFKAVCTTPGKNAGEIVTEPLTAKPVYIKGKRGAKEERGLATAPEKAGPFAVFECGGTKITVENGVAADNSVIGVIAGAEVSVQRAEVMVNYNQAGGMQEPREYENEKGEKVLDFLESRGEGGLAPFAREESAEEAHENKLTFKSKGVAERVELT